VDRSWQFICWEYSNTQMGFSLQSVHSSAQADSAMSITVKKWRAEIDFSRIIPLSGTTFLPLFRYNHLLIFKLGF
jgi:hypothetical protein